MRVFLSTTAALVLAGLVFLVFIGLEDVDARGTAAIVVVVQLQANKLVLLQQDRLIEEWQLPMNCFVTNYVHL